MWISSDAGSVYRGDQMACPRRTLTRQSGGLAGSGAWAEDGAPQPERWEDREWARGDWVKMGPETRPRWAGTWAWRAPEIARWEFTEKLRAAGCQVSLRARREKGECVLTRTGKDRRPWSPEAFPPRITAKASEPRAHRPHAEETQSWHIYI